MTAPIVIRRQAQRGVVLFIALIVLVAMSLTGLALMRNVDTGTLIASNLAFKQGAVHATDRGIEQARAWLMANAAGATLFSDAVGNGYFATTQSNLDLLGNDPTKVDFNWSNAVDLGADAAGNRAQYVIHRMCDAVGDAATTNCLRVNAGGGTTEKKGGVDYRSQGFTFSGTVYYRVTVKVTGPRNTTVFVQSTMY